MFANVDRHHRRASAEVLTLPRTAIVYSLYGDNVFVVVARARRGAGTGAGGEAGLIVERRFVRVGATRGERSPSTDGVKAGERVVIAGQIKLQAEFARRDRRERRAAAARRDAEAVTARR